MGRGTTLLEALLLARTPFGNDINPLSRILIQPRLNPPALTDIIARVAEIDFTKSVSLREDLLAPDPAKLGWMQDTAAGLASEQEAQWRLGHR